VVLNAGFILVFLNNLVIYLVSFPVYVNTAHFLFSNLLAGMSWGVCGVFGSFNSYIRNADFIT
jgi:hypothetical protein